MKLVTYLIDLVIVQRAIFCAPSSLAQLDLEMEEPQAWPAYVIFGLMYVW